LYSPRIALDVIAEFTEGMKVPRNIMHYDGETWRVVTPWELPLQFDPFYPVHERNHR
jgi:hypothetical protein